MRWVLECYDCESMCEVTIDSQPEYCPCWGGELDQDNIRKIEEPLDIDSFDED